MRLVAGLAALGVALLPAQAFAYRPFDSTDPAVAEPGQVEVELGPLSYRHDDRGRSPLYYQFVRHQIYLGFIIAFWAAPAMTAGRLLFAAVTSAYIVVGIMLEDRDLVDLFGDEYRRHKDRVSMLVPWRRSA